MAKFRSIFNFATQYASVKQGYAIGIENFIFLKEETTPGTFNPPSIGTQGKSLGGDTAPSEDISAGTDDSLQVSVDGGSAVTATITSLTGLNTGDLIAAALETAINTALAAGGQDSRVWVQWNTDHYEVYSQKLGTSSAVVITDATSNNLADDLELGSGNGGTETAGTSGTDFLFMTKAGLSYAQDFEPSAHRTGRQPTNIIRKKKVVEGELEMYVNMATGSSPTLDSPVALLLESIFGRKTEVAGTSIAFDMADPSSKYFSILQCNNVFSRAVNGGYAKSMTLNLPGDGEAMMTIPLKGRDSKEMSIAQIDGAVSASASVAVNTGEGGGIEANARVMVVDPDGRTVVAGADGSLTISSVTGDDIVLSAAVSVDDDGFLVPWSPQVFGTTGTDNPVVGLEGAVSFDGGSTTIEQIRSVEITVDPKLEDLDNYYGADGNRGYVVGDRADIMVNVELNLSADQFRRIIGAKAINTFSMKIVLGPSSGRRLEITCPYVRFKPVSPEIPDAGTVPVTFEGQAFQSATGAYDAITFRYL